MIAQDANTGANGAAAAERWNWRTFGLLLCALALLVPYICGALPWAYEHGLPFKPRDFTLLFVVLTAFLVLIGEPRLCLPAFALLIVPLWRVLDAAFLQRFEIEALEGGHMWSVMTMASNLLVSFMGVLVLASPAGRRIAVWIALGVIAVCAGSVFYEWMGFESFTRIDGRMSGFAEDPNSPPIFICLMLGVLLTLEGEKFWRNFAVIGVSGAAVALSLSRSGMAVFACMVALYLLLNARKRLVGMLALAAVVTPLALAGVAILGETAERHGVIKDENTTARMEAIYELDFEKLKSPERAKDLQDGWEAVGIAPLLGHGTGAGTTHWQPHNQFVSIWLDIGIGGLLIFLVTLLSLSFQSLLKRFRGAFCLVPIWLYIPCSQILLEMPAYWMAAGVCCYVLFPKRYAIRLSAARRHTALAPQAAEGV